VAVGLSQVQLAGEQLSASYVSLMEAGRRQPTDRVLQLLADRLGVTVEMLRDGVDPRARQELGLRLRYAELALQNGEAEEALTAFRALAEEGANVPSLVADVAWGEARALEALGRLEDAVTAYEKIRAADVRDPAGAARWAETVIALCRCSVELGDLGRAVELGEDALDHLDVLGLDGTELQAQLVSSLLFAYFQRGDLVRAQLLADALIASVDARPSRVARGAAYWNASLVAESRGRLAEALDLAERALAMFAESDNRRSIARLRIAYAWLLMRQDDPPLVRAEALLRQAREELVDTGTAVDLAYCDTELARVRLLSGDPVVAARLAGEVLDQLGDTHMESGRVMLVLGQALFQMGDAAAAREQVAAAARALNGAGSPRQAASAWREAGDALQRLGDTDAAIEAYQRALGLLGVQAVSVPTQTVALPVGP
jgi:tetratricopeptide (TPR) repeat protein